MPAFHAADRHDHRVRPAATVRPGQEHVTRARQREPATGTPAGRTSPAGVLALQRAIGNQAVTRVLAASEAAPAARSARPARPAGPVTVQRARRDVQDRLTDRHWQKRAAGLPTVRQTGRGKGRTLGEIITRVGPDLIDDMKRMYRNQGTAKHAGQLKLYRNMRSAEADAILEFYADDKLARTRSWVRSQRGVPPEKAQEKFHASQDRIGAMPVRNHLGDEAQARGYGTAERTLEFTLKPGAHELLFSPDYMALSGDGGAPAALRNIAGPDDPYKTASQNEGVLAGYVGLKPERHGDFSLSLGESQASQLLFQLFVASVRDVT